MPLRIQSEQAALYANINYVESSCMIPQKYYTEKNAINLEL